MKAIKIRADQIKRALSKRHTDDLFLTEVKTGATWNNTELLKFDALAMKKSWANPCLTGYEVKVSRGDFVQDQKWPGYMAYCHKFSFVCPKGLISKDELPEEVGLIYYYPDTGALRSERPAKHRMVEIPSDIYQYILMSRTESDRHPFFSNSREMLEAYVSDKADRKALGSEVSSKLVAEIRELRKKVRDVDWAWNNWEDEMRQRLSVGVNPQVIKIMNQITASTEELARMLQPVETK